MLLIRSSKLVILALLAVIALGASSALAANGIEGIWSFKGGSVAIQALPNGTFQGTVATETEFVECPHPAGEVMWTGISQQADGSYWGFHQWFHSGCVLDPQFVGPTAWRVLKNSTGASYLKVCFSHPGTTQPKIAPNGTDTEATYGCYESALIEPLPGSAGGSPPISFPDTVVLPNAKACVSLTSLKIALKDHKNDPLEQVIVKINGKQVADVKGIKTLAKILKKGITLTKLPSGTYKVSVLATTVLKQHLTGSATYKSCTKGSGKIKLKGGKKHHG